MSRLERPDDFETRRAHLRGLSDEALHERFWSLVEALVEPLIEEARTHTTPSIERSVLLRMGFSSVEAKALVEQMQRRDLLGHGAGGLVLKLSRHRGIPVREAGLALLAGRDWEVLSP
jgi:D-ornithine 4,5-aminomutase subunit alpha